MSTHSGSAYHSLQCNLFKNYDIMIGANSSLKKKKKQSALLLILNLDLCQEPDDQEMRREVYTQLTNTARLMHACADFGV